MELGKIIEALRWFIIIVILLIYAAVSIYRGELVLW
jgi:hypothetical protein